MSEEIVDRLKAEGQLMRNTGTNSLRTVRIELEKFNEIIVVISDNIAKQTEMMAKSLDIQLDNFKISQETAEREKAREDIESLDDDEPADKDDDTKKEKEESESKGLFSLLSGLGLGKLLMGGALLGAGLFAAYNFAKGFVDENYNNAWSNFETGLVETLRGLDFEKLKKAFNDIVDGLIAVGVAALAVQAALTAMRTTILAIKIAELLGLKTPAGTPPGGAPRGGGLKNFGKFLLRQTPGLAALFAGSEFYRIWDERQAMTPEQIEKNQKMLAETGQTINPASEFAAVTNEMTGATTGDVPPKTQSNVDINTDAPLQPSQPVTSPSYTPPAAPPPSYTPPAAPPPSYTPPAAPPPSYTPPAAPPPSYTPPSDDEIKQRAIKLLQGRADEIDNELLQLENSGNGGTIRYNNLVEELQSITNRLINLRGSEPGGSIDIESGRQGRNSSSLDSSSLLDNRILRSAAANNTNLPGKIEKVASESSKSSINMPIIVNNNPAVSPMFYNVTTGPSVTTNTMFGLGGNNGNGNATFGLSNAIS